MKKLVLLFFGVFYVQAPATPSFVKTARDLGSVAASDEIKIRLWLAPRNAEELAKLAVAVSDKNSPYFLRFLSQDEYQARFAPLPAEGIKVRNYLARKGFSLNDSSLNLPYVEAKASVKIVENTF